jgi:hypothetical protein
MNNASPGPDHSPVVLGGPGPSPVCSGKPRVTGYDWSNMCPGRGFPGGRAGSGTSIFGDDSPT